MSSDVIKKWFIDLMEETKEDPDFSNFENGIQPVDTMNNLSAG